MMAKQTKVKCPHCGEEQEQKPEKKFYCEDCEEYFDAFDAEPMYECQECSEVFTRSGSKDGMGHSCPECGRWGSKLYDHVCTTCEAEAELEEVLVYICQACGEQWHEGQELEAKPWKCRYKRHDKLILRQEVDIPRFVGTTAEHKVKLRHPCYAIVSYIDRDRHLVSVDIALRYDYTDYCSWGSGTHFAWDEETVDKYFWKPSSEEWEKWWGENHWFTCKKCGRRTLAKDGYALGNECNLCSGRDGII